MVDPSALRAHATALATLDPYPIAPEDQERHRYYALLVLALVGRFFNGNKRGRDGTYPTNEDPDVEQRAFWARLSGDYLGHNIAAIAVDDDGRIIDFEMNHNAILNSSVEHAESRLVRRIFSLAQIHDSWNVRPLGPARDDYDTFEKVTVYTSLEPCSQCAGIMALARVKEVVYLQTDPQMNHIGHILHNLTLGSRLQAPRPITGAEIGLRYFAELDAAYQAFKGTVGPQAPFFVPRTGGPDVSTSITSFLCTRAARVLMRQADAELLALSASQPTRRPPNASQSVLDDGGALEEAKAFLAYADRSGRRGTPHKL